MNMWGVHVHPVHPGWIRPCCIEVLNEEVKMWKNACALWLQKVACSFHVGNVDVLHTDRYYEGNFRSNEMSLFWRIPCCLLLKLYTTRNVSLKAFEQNVFRWCTVHACVPARANISVVSRHWKCLLSGLIYTYLLPLKEYKRITRKKKKETVLLQFKTATGRTKPKPILAAC